MQFMFDKCIPIEITPLVKTSKSIMATESVVLIVFLLYWMYFGAQYWKKHIHDDQGTIKPNSAFIVSPNHLYRSLS